MSTDLDTAWSPAEWGPSLKTVADRWGLTELEVLRSARLYGMCRDERDAQERLMSAAQPKGKPRLSVVRGPFQPSRRSV